MLYQLSYVGRKFIRVILQAAIANIQRRPQFAKGIIIVLELADQQLRLGMAVNA
ncbi:MAG: hypothetical protein NTY46_14280 [Candidatus Sumerlaeota bacterium]|nr:hypothetical protein [Candidatus Sumerlaeota bacterium]